MASGFDSTAFGTGLINSINNQNAQAAENVQQGDRAQYASFLEAQKEYDAAKAKAGDQKNKIDAMANIISNGNPNPAAYATARDAVEMGYTGTEHLPYVMDAYQRTVEAMKDDPETWTGATAPDRNSTAAPGGQQFQDTDTRPDQTAIARKFGDRTPVNNMEDVRQHNVPKAYEQLPSGKWGDPAAIANKTDAAHTYAVTTASKQADTDAAKRDQANDASSLGLNGEAEAMPSDNMNPSAQAQNQNGQSTAQAGGSAVAMNQSALAQSSTPTPPAQQPIPAQAPAPASAGGELPPPKITNTMNLDGTPPPETTGGMSTPAGAVQPAQATPAQGQSQSVVNQTPAAADANTPNKGINIQYRDWLRKNNPVQASLVEQVASGEIIIPAASLRNVNGQPSPMFNILAAAHKLDPTFNMQAPELRKDTVDAYSPKGPVGKQISALDTAISHLGAAQQAGDALANHDMPTFNKIANEYGLQTGSAPKVVFDAIAHSAAPELVGAYRPGGGSEADIAQREKDLSSSFNSTQRDAMIKTQIELLNGKLMPIKNTWNYIMGPYSQGGPNGKNGGDWLTPNSQAVMQNIGVNQADPTPYLTQKNQMQQNAPVAQKPNQDISKFTDIWK